MQNEATAMKTFRINEDWNTFKDSIIDKLEVKDKDSTGFMHREREIIVRTSDESVYEIISKSYETQFCDVPENFISRGWSYLGNRLLFGLRL